MKQFPAQYVRSKDPSRPLSALVKRKPSAKISHLSAPLKGLNRRAELAQSDPQYASIMTNWVVETDRITVRSGTIQIGSIASGKPISSLVPHHGENEKFVAAAEGKFYNTNGTVASPGPYGSDYWAWTMFANLSQTDYTIMVNGYNGVNSWDGITFVKEAVTAPAGEPWLLVDKIDKVYAHMNRLFFADSTNLCLYYLPVQTKSGTLNILPLNAIFRRGGYIVAIHSWVTQGGVGMGDVIVVFTSNGECAIYQGVDPASDWTLVGVFRFDAPLSKTSIINFGGDLYVMISTGFVPMSTLLKAETDNLGITDLNVMMEFEEVVRANRDAYGWSVILNSQRNYAICNLPLGNGQYQQMIRRMPDQVWTKWVDLPSRCWLWFQNHSYFASDDGKIYMMGPEYLNDNGAPINADVRFSWSSYQTPVNKQFKLAQVYSINDGIPRPFIDMEVDYESKPPSNQPELTTGGGPGAPWDTSSWDTSIWDAGTTAQQGWQGISGLGRVGALRVRVSVSSCVYSITGVDVIYEYGGLL